MKRLVTLDDLSLITEIAGQLFLDMSLPPLSSKELQALLFCKALEEFLHRKGADPNFTMETKEKRKGYK